MCAPHRPVGIKWIVLIPDVRVKRLNGLLERGDATRILGVLKFGRGRKCKCECGESITRTLFQMRRRTSRRSERRIKSGKCSAALTLPSQLANEQPDTKQTGSSRRVGPVRRQRQVAKCAHAYEHEKTSERKKSLFHWSVEGKGFPAARRCAYQAARRHELSGVGPASKSCRGRNHGRPGIPCSRSSGRDCAEVIRW